MTELEYLRVIEANKALQNLPIIIYQTDQCQEMITELKQIISKYQNNEKTQI